MFLKSPLHARFADEPPLSAREARAGANARRPAREIVVMDDEGFHRAFKGSAES